MSRSFLPKNKKWKVLFFDQNYGLTPLENIEKCDYLKCIFLWARNDSFLSKRSSNIIFKIIFAQKQKMKKMLVFIPLENMQIYDYLKCIFFKG